MNTYTISDLMSILKISRATIWRKLKTGEIPQPDMNLGSQKRPQWRWTQSTIDSYLSSPPTTASS